MQCTHDADPSLRTEDTAGDGLWELATSFENEQNYAAAVETWRYLAAKYPANRHASEAKHLADTFSSAGAPVTSPSPSASAGKTP